MEIDQDEIQEFYNEGTLLYTRFRRFCPLAGKSRQKGGGGS